MLQCKFSRTIITNAIEADKKVKAKFETHLEGINLLNGDISALQAALPSCGSSGASQSSAAGQLRQLMENVTWRFETNCILNNSNYVFIRWKVSKLSGM